MDATLPVVQMFWHGPPLSRLERLCIASFVANGHRVDLYAYEEPANVPAGVQVKDAAQVLNREYLFSHKRTGSVGLFTDWFRYRLLLDHGGIWADADVVCLQPLRYERPEIFAWQDPDTLCGAVLGLSAGHELAAWLTRISENPNALLPYDTLRMRLRKWRRRFLQGNRRDRIRWGEHGPRGLTLAAQHLGYIQHALPSWHFYPVHYHDWYSLFESDPGNALLSRHPSRAVHLWNNMAWGKPGFDKNARFPADSPFERLCSQYLRSDDEAIALRS